MTLARDKHDHYKQFTRYLKFDGAGGLAILYWGKTLVWRVTMQNCESQKLFFVFWMSAVVFFLCDAAHDPVTSHCSRVQPFDKVKVKCGLRATLDKSSDSPTRLPFLPTTAAWLWLNPSLSQPISFPATGWDEAQLSIDLLCCVNDKEMQWEALNRSMWRSFFEILQVLFFKPRLCNSPSTPSVTSLLRWALTPLTSSHPGSLGCSPYHAALLSFLTIPWRYVVARDYGQYLFRAQVILTLLYVALAQTPLPRHMAAAPQRTGGKYWD